jgi:predicted HTH transcriptional regulator
MKYKKVTISIPETDYTEWISYSKLYGSFSHFVRESISEFIKTQDDKKRIGLFDIILDQKNKFDDISKKLDHIQESVVQKQKVEDIVKLQRRCLNYLKKVERASDAELIEILDIDEEEFLELTSILLKQNLIDAVEIQKEYYWIYKKKDK